MYAPACPANTGLECDTGKLPDDYGVAARGSIKMLLTVDVKGARTGKFQSVWQSTSGAWGRRVRAQNRAAVFTTLFSLAISGCGGATNERSALPQNDNGGGGTYTSQWTAGIIDRPQLVAHPTTLVAVRTGAHKGFDRIVFEFDEYLPGYHTEYIDQPVRKCGSGSVTPVAGDGWLELRMYPAKAHTEEGLPTVAERERMLNHPVLAELELTCDFEAVVTWVFGVESPNRYQVSELSSPPRLVIDIRQ